MLKLKLKDIKKYESDEVMKRLKEYQQRNNTSSVCDAYDLGLKCIGYSAGANGCNGQLYEDLNTGEWYGVPHHNCCIYIR